LSFFSSASAAGLLGLAILPQQEAAGEQQHDYRDDREQAAILLGCLLHLLLAEFFIDFADETGRGIGGKRQGSMPHCNRGRGVRRFLPHPS